MQLQPGELATVIKGMFGTGAGGVGSLSVLTVFTQNIFLIALSVVACTSLGSFLRKRLYAMTRGNDLALNAFGVLEAVTPVVLLALSLIALAGASYNPFIYFQF